MEWQKPELHEFEEQKADGQCTVGSGDAVSGCTGGAAPGGACLNGSTATGCTAGSAP